MAVGLASDNLMEITTMPNTPKKYAPFIDEDNDFSVLHNNGDTHTDTVVEALREWIADDQAGEFE